MRRRSFLHGAAGLVVAFSIPRFAEAGPSTVETDSVDAYLAIAPDGGVTVYAGKVDLGTGARAAIRQIVAEELGLRPEKIAMVEGDTALTPNQGGTGGSTGIMVGGIQIRQAAATARQGLINLATTQLKLPADARKRPVTRFAVSMHFSAEPARIAASTSSTIPCPAFSIARPEPWWRAFSKPPAGLPDGPECSVKDTCP